MTEEILIEVESGSPAAPDHGGAGQPVLLVREGHHRAEPADRGFSAARRAEVAAVVAPATGRRPVDVAAGHDLVMTHPREVTAVIRDAAAG